jgi:hypothetical protein
MESAMTAKSCPLVPLIPRSTLLIGLAFWTAYWVRAGWQHLQAESVVAQQGFGGDGVQMWELFDLQMVGAYPLLRWLPGAVLLLGGWLYLRRRAAAGARRTDDSAGAGVSTPEGSYGQA